MVVDGFRTIPGASESSIENQPLDVDTWRVLGALGRQVAGALIVERKRPAYRKFFATLATSFLHLDGQGAKSQSLAVILIGVSIGIPSLGMGWAITA